MAQQFPIRVDPMFRMLFALIGAGARHDFVRVDDDCVHVQLGWAFRADIPRSAVAAATHHPDMYGGWGAHGWSGRWLVNGSSKGIIQVDLLGPVPARLLYLWPLRLRTLYVSLADPEGFLVALGYPAAV